MELTIEPRRLRLRRPLETAWGSLSERELLVVRLESADGGVGHGEAAPLEPYDGVPLEAVRAALEAYRPVLAGAEAAPRGETLQALHEAADLPQALAAVDLAFWDLAGRRERRPVAALLAEHPAPSVEVNATIGAEDRAGAAAEAAAAAAAGFGCVKVKVGIGDDAGRIAAVRAAAGPEMAIRVDANGAWTPEEAVAALASLAPAGLELAEEPVHGLANLRRVRAATPVRVAMDETATHPGALASGATDAVCIKISRCGGIASTLAAATLVRTTGAEPYLASTFDGPLGIAAAIHVAAALAPLPPCGLATLALFEDPGDAALLPRNGRIRVPRGPGLGVSPPVPI